jgi:hypothetical protein
LRQRKQRRRPKDAMRTGEWGDAHRRHARKSGPERYRSPLLAAPHRQRCPHTVLRPERCELVPSAVPRAGAGRVGTRVTWSRWG